jgi:hypothetical protein
MPNGEESFPSPPPPPPCLWSLGDLLLIGYPGLFLRVKRSGHENDCSLPSRVEVTKAWISAFTFFFALCHIVGRDSSVGIATRYGLDGPGIQSRWMRDFSHLPGPAVMATQPPIQWISVHSPGAKRSRFGVNNPSSSSVTIKERVELCLHSPSVPLWNVIGWISPLYAYITS